MQDVTTRHFKVFQTYREAWHLIKGSKWTIWATAIIVALIGAVFLFTPALINLITHELSPSRTTPLLSLNESPERWFIVATYLLAFIFFVPGSFAALGKIVIERVRNHPISVKMGLSSLWHRIIPVSVTFIFAYALIIVPPAVIEHFLQTQPTPLALVAFVIYALLVGTSVSLGLFFAIDKTINPFAALYRSVKATWPHFFRVVGFIIINECIGILAQLPLRVGEILHMKALTIGGTAFLILALIWVIPLQLLAFGLMYRKLVD